MSEIRDLIAREIIDSRGNPTVECDVILASGARGRASVPSGASTGTREAVERRDGDQRFAGKGVMQAVQAIENEIRPKLVGIYATEQDQVDQLLIDIDGTENKARLGANATLAVSLASAHAAAADMQVPFYRYLAGDGMLAMPVPMMNILNGGAHADNNVDIQEFMIMPLRLSSFREALRCGTEIFHCLRKVLQQKGLVTMVGDEGGFAPNLKANVEALDYLMQAIEQAGYRPGEEVYIALDAAASEFYTDGKYHLASENQSHDAESWVNVLQSWVEQYPIVSIEDACDEGDHAGWALLTEKLGDQVQLVGDDLFVTNTKIIEHGIEHHLANAVLIKPNQIGTLSETLNAIAVARKGQYQVIISHRSGETEDTSIADLAVATCSGQIKTGSACRTDRVAKYNQLLRIEAELADQALYPGKDALGRPIKSWTS